MLENELKQKCNSDPKLIWPVLFKRFIDDGFGTTLGLWKDVIYWIEKFNELREPIKIDDYNWGNALDYMDLFIYKGKDFYEGGKLSVSIHQKRQINSCTSPTAPIIKDTQSRTMFGAS